jgi:hypothetical protein
MEKSLFHVHHFLKQVLIEWLILFSKVKYISGPGEMLVPIGSSIPFFTAVPEMTVCTNLGENCGSVNIQRTFLIFIFLRISINLPTLVEVPELTVTEAIGLS